MENVNLKRLHNKVPFIWHSQNDKTIVENRSVAFRAQGRGRSVTMMGWHEIVPFMMIWNSSVTDCGGSYTNLSLR